MPKKIMYLRSAPYEVSSKSYNLQEIGLLSEFCKKGIDCDLYYYSHKEKEEIIEFTSARLKIHWIKGIRLLRSGVYPKLLNRKFLSQFDVIICSEYSQIMTVLLARLHNNVYCYNGPYYNLFKLKFMEKIYDRLFVLQLQKNIRMFFCKSQLSVNYLKRKGLENSLFVGVGQNTDKFKTSIVPTETTKRIINIIDNNTLLYVGSIDERKNFPFLLKVFQREYKINNKRNLLIIGKGKKNYINKQLNSLDNEVVNKITIIPFIDNNQLKFIYPKAFAFLLPSKLEIFGMVMLEAMYFGVPVVSSYNGGSSALIKNKVNGIVAGIDDVNRWVEAIQYLDKEDNREDLINNARSTIVSDFSWDSIANTISTYILN